MNPLKTYIDKMKTLREASSFVPKEKWELEPYHSTTDCDECGAEIDLGGYIIKSTDEHQAVDINLYGMKSICEPQATFIATSANEWLKLLSALEIACDALETICKRSAYDLDWHSDGKDYGVADQTLSEITKIVGEG